MFALQIFVCYNLDHDIARKGENVLFTSVHQERNFKNIISQIKQAIISGELKVGDCLPTEGELTQIFGVSRSSVREALKALEVYGLIESRKGGGSFVVNNLLPSMTDSLSMYFRLQGCTLRDLIELRHSIELGAVREVINSATDAEIKELGDCLNRYLNSSTTDERQLYDMNFHSVLVTLSKNTLYQYMLSTFNDIYSKDIYYSHQVIEDQGQLEESCKIHEELYKAICARDMNAATEWLNRHFDFSQEDITRQTNYFFGENNQ